MDYIILGIVLRLVLWIFGVWQDHNFDVKYTDIDYYVYHEASAYVSEGLSPYDRHTYRYTPLLAYLLVPNGWFFEWGKLLFMGADILAGFMMMKVLEKDGQRREYAFLYLLNPIVANMSTRGSSDSISSVLIIGTMYYLKEKDIFKAGVFYGLAVHFRIYPIIYGISFWLFIDKHSSQFFTKNRFKFFFVSAGLFLALIGVFYAIYGWTFLYETYLYHVTRKDNRHNFSLYFYMLYLTYETSASLLGLFAFVPQWSLVFYTGLKFARENLPLTMMIQTFVFVIFNKVCTAQYFLWYMTLLPVFLPYLNIGVKKGVTMVLVWGLCEVHWLYWGYRLEFLGESVFLGIWAASCLFFLANLWVLIEVISNFKVKQKF